jgi:two-component system phosphate regulon response regulator PhoB
MMKRKILIIDDESAFTKMVKITLEATKPYDCEVRVVNDPALATGVAREFVPDIILLDIVMPELDGGDVLSQLRADPALKKIPVIFLTATVRRSEVNAHNGLIGGEFFLAKPVSAEDLIRTIEERLAPDKPGKPGSSPSSSRSASRGNS